MKIKNTVISALLIVAALFVQFNISSELAFAVNPNEPFIMVEEKETSIKDGQENIPIITRAIIGFNRNVSTSDVLEHNKDMIKIYDESGNEIPANITAEGGNKLELSIQSGLQPGRRYHIKVFKGIAAQGGGEFTDNEYNISFTTEGSTPSEGQTESVSELDKLKEDVERAQRESEENAKLMKEAEEQKRKSEEEAKKLEEEKKEVEIPEEQQIDSKEIDEAVKQEDQLDEDTDKQDNANPRVFIFAVIILALIVIIIVALMQSINRNKKDIDSLEEKVDEANKDDQDNKEEQDNKEDQQNEDDKVKPEEKDLDQIKDSDTDINGTTGRFEGIKKKDN